MNWIDVHTHLNMLEDGVDTSLKLASENGVAHMITIGTTPEDWPVVSEIAEKNFPRVACTIGVHPHDAQHWTSSAEKELRRYVTLPHVIAVGEIGLDYYYNNSPAAVQLAAFREQMKVAEEAKLPVEIHTRDAEEDTAMVLKEFKGRVQGLLHCFTSSKHLAEVGIDCGFDISFSGVVTFKNADSLREVVKSMPLDRIHVETDAPFLAPVPMRGKKNQPAYVVHTAEKVSQLRGMPLIELAEATRANARRLFPRWSACAPL